MVRKSTKIQMHKKQKENALRETFLILTEKKYEKTITTRKIKCKKFIYENEIMKIKNK